MNTLQKRKHALHYEDDGDSMSDREHRGQIVERSVIRRQALTDSDDARRAFLPADAALPTDVYQEANGKVQLSSEEHRAFDQDAISSQHPFAVPQQAVEDTICPLCKGAQWVRHNVAYGDPDFGKRFACSCLLQKRRMRRQQEMLALCIRLGLQRDKTMHPESFHPQAKGVQQALRETKRFLKLLEGWTSIRDGQQDRERDVDLPAPAAWLVMVGPHGAGKSHLAMAIANAAIDADITTVYASTPLLLDYLRQAFDPKNEVVYDDLFEQIRTAELLILDDMGTEQSTPWADEKLFQLLNYRYNCGVPTVVTLKRAVWSFLDQRLKSRFSDTSLVELVQMEQAQGYRARKGTI